MDTIGWLGGLLGFVMTLSSLGLNPCSFLFMDFKASIYPSFWAILSPCVLLLFKSSIIIMTNGNRSRSYSIERRRILFAHIFLNRLVPASFNLFSFYFKHKFYRKTVVGFSGIWTLDCRRRRQTCWPLHHHHHGTFLTKFCYCFVF